VVNAMPYEQEGRIRTEFDHNSEKLQILCEPYHLHAPTNPAGVSVVHENGASSNV